MSLWDKEYAPVNWGETIRKRRRSLDWTQEVLAKKSGVALSTIQSWESGKTGMNAETLGIVLDALGMELKAVRK